MSLDLGAVLTVAELVQKAIAIYERIENLPQQMARIGRRMELLNIFLVRLQNFIEREAAKAKTLENGKKAEEPLFGGQLEDLRELLAEIKSNAVKVHDLFDRYEKGIVSRTWDLEFRQPFFARVWFSVFDNSADKAEAIIREIDQERNSLRDYLMLMAVERAYEPRQGRTARRAMLQPENANLGRRQRAAPSPSPGRGLPRRDYRILFVDPYNIARSVVAQALIILFGKLTIQAGADWRVTGVQSAGFFVKKRCDCVDVIDGLEYSHPSFRIPWVPGGRNPKPASIAALFDNTWCDYPFKEDIRKRTATRTSRGVSKDMFSDFDFVIVFTLREHDNMVKLKSALRNESGAGGKLHGDKGRVIHLGTYLAQKKGEVREILDPDKTDDDPVKSRERWNQKVSEIKAALKGFLRQELGWTPPTGKRPVADKASKLEGKGN